MKEALDPSTLSQAQANADIEKVDPRGMNKEC